MPRVVMILLALACAPAPHAAATTVLPMDLAQLVQLAGHAFAGTVSTISSDYNAAHTTLVTKVHFVDVVAVKGNLRSEAVLCQRGGTIPDDQVIVEGQPEFQVGGRYIVLAFQDLGSEENLYLPIVGLWQGVFRVVPERAGGPPIVTTWEGRPVVGLSDRRLMVVRTDADTSDGTIHLVAQYIPERAKKGASMDDRHVREPHVDTPEEVERAREIREEYKRAIEARPRTVRPVTPPARPDTAAAPRAAEWPRIRVSPEPLLLVPKSADTGKRVSEQEFLDIIRSLAGRG